MKTALLKFAGTSVLALLLTSGASAVPIIGSIDIFGQATLNNSNLGAATSVSATTGTVVLADGDFAPLNGATANYSAFTWAPATVPVTPLWSIAGPLTASFELLTLVVETQDFNHLDLAGTGVLRLEGFDDTFGLWSYAITDSDGVGTGSGQLQFGFLSSNSAVPQVPEGGATALLVGFVLVCLSILSRRRKIA